MSKKVLRVAKAAVFGGFILFMAVSCKPSDNQIARTVTSVVTTVAPNVFVNVQNGVVTLRGTIPDPATKTTLDSTVKGFKGVVSVVDMTSLKAVEPPPPPPPSTTPYAMDYPDSLVERTLDTAFKYNHISGIKSKVVNGVITLTGNANKKDLKTIMLIANESNPKKVINKLTIK